MSSRLTALPRTAALVCLLASLALVGPAAAHAATTPWGDTGHFGEAESELRHPEAAFGVNSADGSVWTVDKVVVGGGEEELRLQKFVKEGSSWKVVAKALLGTVETAAEDEREAEGVAFDPTKERAYVLITDDGPKTAKNEAAAGELLAFSTKTPGATIEPASGTKTGGVLVPMTSTKLTGSPVGKSEFAPYSTEKGAALVSPGGIAVNPVSHQILMTGWIGAIESAIPVMWAVSETGQIQAVWEDKTNYFGRCGCLNSPVVTPSGKVLAIGETEEGRESGVFEMPAELSSGAAPKRVVWLPQSKFECEVLQREKEEGKKVETCPFFETIATIDSGPNYLGGEMAAGPKGELFVHVKVRNASEGGFEAGAVMTFSPTFEMTGWTGGGSWGSGSKECAVNESNPGNLAAALVGGYEGKAFMLERGEPTEGEHAKVLTLGSGGNAANCPKATAGKPQAEAGGAKGSSFPVADKLTLSSTMTQANALRSEWELEEGAAVQTVGRQQTATSISHQFVKGGSITIKETINTDDLASPSIETSEKITLVTPAVREEVATPSPTEATLKAEVNPSKNPTKCEFQVAPAGTELGGAGTKTLACSTSPGEEEKWVVETVKATGLTAGTHYCFRLLAKAGLWAGSQPCTEFVTPSPGAPVVVSAAPTSVTATGATLNGTVNPEGKETKRCEFEYGTTLPLDKKAVCAASPGKGTAAVSVSAAVTGLSGATEYKVQLVDENAEGKKGEGGLKAFKTAEAATAPSAETLSASPTSTSAVLHGAVNPHGENTSCHFELGTSTGYGISVPCATPPGEGKLSVSEAVTASGLTPGSVYHYRIVAENKVGASSGADKEFRTTAESGGTTTTTTTTTGTGEVRSFIEESAIVKIASTSLSVASSGSFALKLSCPGGVKECAGTVTVKTAGAVAASVAHASKKAVLTLATGSFKIVGGKLVSVALHLNAKAKRYLAKAHTVRAKATISAHNAQGKPTTSTISLTLKVARKKKH